MGCLTQWRRVSFPLAVAALAILTGATTPADAASAVGRAALPASPVRFAVLSDPHFYDVKLGTGGTAYDNYIAADPKLLHLSEPIFDAAVADIMTRNVRFVIISGDLTKDGEILNHVRVTRYLQKLEQAGIEVFVVPGNHDINNADAVEYRGANTKPVPSASPEVFRALYQRFGYGQALSHAPDSLSYVAEAASGLWLLALDSNKWMESESAEHPVVSGRLSPATMTWALEKLQQARLAGKTVIAFMHHGVNPHFLAEPQIFPDYLVDNWWSVSAQLASAGLKVIFTGHYHSQDASSWTLDAVGTPQPISLCDVQTSSILAYPCAYRVAELDNAGQLLVQSRRVTQIAANLNGLTFQQYAEAFERALLPYQVIVQLAYLFGITVEQAHALIPAWVVGGVVDGLIANYAGDEAPSPETQALLNFLLGQPAGSNEYRLGSLLYTLWFEPPFPPTDNTLIVSVGS
jgi:hypothetical protein